jgi:acetyltransferase-like isoleucine patch superfamily enzyme
MIRGGYQCGNDVDLSEDVHPNNAILGDRVRIRPLSILFGSPEHPLKIGNDVYVNSNCWFHGAAAPLTIGNNVSFGPGVRLFTDSGPNTCTLLQDVYPLSEGPVTIEDQVWVGAGAMIMPGVTIGHGSVVGALSIVKEDVPPHSVVAGIPAKIIKTLDTHRTNCHVCSIH